MTNAMGMGHQSRYKTLQINSCTALSNTTQLYHWAAGQVEGYWVHIQAGLKASILLATAGGLQQQHVSP